MILRLNLAANKHTTTTTNLSPVAVQKKENVCSQNGRNRKMEFHSTDQYYVYKTWNGLP